MTRSGHLRGATNTSWMNSVPTAPSTSRVTVPQLLVGVTVFVGSIGLVISLMVMTIAWVLPGGMDPWRYFVVGMCISGIVAMVIFTALVISESAQNA